MNREDGTIHRWHVAAARVRFQGSFSCKGDSTMRSVILVATVVLCVLSAGFADAALIGTYVDATPGVNTLSGAAFSTIAARSDTDNLWTPYAGFGFGRSDTMTASQGSGSEDAPMLTTTVTGLANGSYNVYVVYETKSDANWLVQAAISGQSLVTYDKTNGTATGTTWESGSTIEMQALLGTVAVTDGSFAVNIDDWAGGPQSPDRTWYDGVSYEVVPEPSTIALLITGLFGLLAYAWRKRK